MNDQVAQTDATAEPGPEGIGQLLRETREKGKLSLTEVATALCIRKGYLQAIEEQRYGDLPGQAYAVGFVRGYAEHLGLDGIEIVRRFKQECDAFANRPALVFPSGVSESSIPGLRVLVLAVLAGILAYGAWYAYRSRDTAIVEDVPALPERFMSLIRHPVGDGSEVVQLSKADAAKPQAEAPAAAAPPAQGEAPPPAPAEVQAQPPAPQIPANPPPAQIQPAAEAAAPAAPHEDVVPPSDEEAPAAPQTQASEPHHQMGVAVETVRPVAQKPGETDPAAAASARVWLRAEEDCWVEIRDQSGQVVFSRLLRKGESHPVPPRPGLVMTAGNAGALAIVVDGKPQAPLGRMGMVRRDIALDPDRLAGAVGE